MGAAAGIRGGGGWELRLAAVAGAEGASTEEVCARAPRCAREWARRAQLCPGRASVSQSAGVV
jgi:hypothetical protein